MGSSLKLTKVFNRLTSAREISTDPHDRPPPNPSQSTDCLRRNADYEGFRTNSPRNDAMEVCGSHPIRVRLATTDAERPVDAMPVCLRRLGR